MLKKMTVVLSGTLGRMVISALTGLVIAQLIGPSTRGVLSVVMTASTLIGLLLGAGLQGSTTLMLASGRWKSSDAVLVAFGASTITTGFASLLLHPLAQRFEVFGSLSNIPVWIVGLGGGLLVLNSLLGAALTGLQLYSAGAKSAISSPVANGMAFGVMLLVGVSGGRAAIYAWLFGLGVSAAVSCFALVRFGGLHLRIPPESGFVVGYGARTLLGNILNYASLRLDVFILASMNTLTAAGQYSVSVAVSEMLWAVPMAIGTVVFPEIASRDREADDGAWTARVCRVTVAVSAVSAVAVGLGGWVLFGLVMRHYSGSLMPLLLLLPGTIALSVAKVLGNDMYGRSLPEWHIYAALASLALTVGLDLAFVPKYGAAAAAAVSSLSYVAYAVVILTGFRRTVVVGIRPLLVIDRRDISDMREITRRLLTKLRGRGV